MILKTIFLKPSGFLKFFLCAICLNANFETVEAQNLRSRILPSPNAATFQLYLDYPVSHSTGLAQTDIPLYNVTIKNANLPVSLSYHASGRRASLNLSPVGVSWALNSGGVISRTIRGAVDKSSRNIPLLSSIKPLNTFTNYSKILSMDPTNPYYYNTFEDYQYDIFSFSVNGKSGTFIHKKNSAFILSSTGQYKIEGNIDPPGPGHSGGFTLTDELGTKYYFGKYDMDYGAIEISSDYISSWFLAKIENTLGEVIRLKYEVIYSETHADKVIGHYSTLQTKAIYDDLLGNWMDIFLPPFSENSSSPVDAMQYYPFQMAYVKEVDFPQGKLIFNYDMANARLSNIVLQDITTSPVKSYDFQYATLNSAMLPNNNSVAPSDIISKDAGGNEVSRYRFEYNSQIISSLRDAFERSKDWWGYYNASEPGSLFHIPYFDNIPVSGGLGFNIPSTIGTANVKDPNLAALMGGSLKKIIYPTGGSAEFKYESNQYSIGGGPTLQTGPGMRIQEIKILDGNNSGYRLIYKYGINENGAGTLVYLPSKYDYVSENKEIESPYEIADEYTSNRAYRRRTYSSEVNDQIASAYSVPVYYTSVTEYRYPLSGSQSLGKTVYSYDIPEFDLYTTEPGTFEFNYGYAGPSTNDPSISFRTFIKKEGTDPNLVLKEIFRTDPAEISGYKRIFSGYYEYSSIATVAVPELLFQRFIDYNYGVGGSVLDNTRRSEAQYSSTTLAFPSYVIGQTYLKGAFKRINKTIETTYNNNGNIETTTNYFYDNSGHLMPTRKVTKNSKGADIVAHFLYPSDYPAGTTFIDNLRSKNILALPIEEVVVKTEGSSGSVLSGKISKYKTGGSGLLEEIQRLDTHVPVANTNYKFSNRAMGQLLPAGTQTTFTPDARYSKEIEFTNYDQNGNLLQQGKTNDIKQSYIWDYNNAYPIAEFVNAPVADIAYTSFESDGKGNWAYLGTPFTEPLAPTGKKVYDLSSGNITSSINSATTYIVSYWRPVGLSSVSIAGTMTGYPVSGRTVNGWKYYEHKISGQSTAAVSGSGSIDELRLYPADGQMTTYTYDPLIGMTSQCDVNNRITYYEYDGFGRLKLVRDQDKNILRQICYNYAGQQQDCDASYTPGVPPVPGSLTAIINAGSAVELHWVNNAVNATVNEVYRSVGDATHYTLLVTLPDNVSAYTDTQTDINTLYFYKIKVASNGGSSDYSNEKSITTPAVGPSAISNTAPVLNDIVDIYVRSGSSKIAGIAATDDAGDILGFVVMGLPDFASFSENGNGTGVFHLSPVNTAPGNFSATVKVIDNYGAFSQKRINIIVTEEGTSHFYINFNNKDYPVSYPLWNSFNATQTGGTQVAANTTLSNLKDETGTASAISVKLLNSWPQNYLGVVTGNNSGVFPDAVIATGYYFYVQASAPQKTIRIAGLNANKQYDLTFYGNRSFSTDQVTRYTTGAQTVTLNSKNNTSDTVQITGLSANGQGEIDIVVDAVMDKYAVINAMVIKEYPGN